MKGGIMSIPSTTLTAQAFIGAWKLESFTEYSGAELPVQPFGLNPVGFLIYTADGLVSVQLMKPDRKQESGGAWDHKHTDGLAELAAGYIAYCGHYFIDESLEQIIHLPVVALIPNLIDQSQYRTFALDNDRLDLRTTRPESDGKIVETRLMWRRHAAR